MHGFKAARERLAYADGGLIGGIKARFFGPEETVSQKFARQDAERAAKAAAKAGAAPAPAQAPAPAGQGISGYAGMSAMQRREKEAGLKDGGIIRGPGTGTSDSIEAEMDEGTYIMPADSTQALGFNPIARLAGQKQKVRVSNGETEITPEQVHDIGAMVLDVVKTLTHVPTPEQEPEGAYAEGGLVEEKDSIRPGRRAAPYVDHRPYTGPQPQRALPNYAPVPGTAVATTPYQPNFTMGAQPAAATAAAVDPATDVRAKYTPDRATKEAKAWQAERAAQQAAAAAPPAAPAAPAAAPAREPGPVARAAQRVGGAAATLARGATPLLLGGAAASTATTPTEDYEQRFGFEPSTSDSPGARLVRDVGVRTLGAMSDVGNALGFGLPSLLYRDRQAQAGAAPAAPAAAPAAAAPARLVQTDVQRGGSAVPAVQEAPQPEVAVSAPAPGPIARLAGGDSRYGFSNFNQAAQAEQALANQNPGAMNFGAYVPGQGLDAWQARQDRKNAETAASSIVNSGTRDAAKRTLARMDAQDIQRTRDAGALAQEQVRADTARAGQAIAQQNNIAGQAAEQQRLGFQARTTAADEALKSTQNQSAIQLLSAQKRLVGAKTPEAKAAAESEILALSGKRENPNRLVVVPGAKNQDGSQDPATVWDTATGRALNPGGGAALPPGMVKQVGTAGGKPVYVDKDGKRFVGD